MATNTTERLKAIKAALEKDPSLPHTEVARITGISETAVRRYRKKLGSMPMSSISTLENNRYKRAYTELKKRYDQAIELLDEKDIALGKFAEISKAAKIAPIKVTATRCSREVVPVIVASDWHIEETVTSAITNGLNEYNLSIAESSIKQFFANACYLVNLHKIDSEVNTVVLAILGDIINGVLRSEDLENNQTSSIDAITMARSLIYSGIKMLAEKTGCNIRVLCCVGNHGRMTEKVHYSNQVHNSLEYLLYKTLERDYRDNPKVDFVVAEAPYVIQEILGVKVRFSHGHNIRFSGGIGGLAVPVLRKVAQMNLIEKADMDVMGHFHSSVCLGNVIMNGSLVGTNGYSMALGLPHERPSQTFFLIDSKYGRSMVTPIFIDREVAKPTVSPV